LLNSIKAQGKLTITSDSASYSYGQPITLEIEILNDSDSTFSFYTCPRAVYKFDNFEILNFIYCVGDPPEYFLSPGRSITWIWKSDPSILGIPNKDGEHIVVGYYGSYLADTIKISAPIYYGGIISVWFYSNLEDKVITLRDSLNATVRQRYDFTNIIYEEWQIQGLLIDSIISKYEGDFRFEFMVRYVNVSPESIITSVEQNKPLSLFKDFEVTETFPNPFNSTTNFYLTLNRTQNILIEVFNSLGQKVSTIYNGMIPSNSKTYFTVDLNNSSAGLYFIRVKGLNNIITKKIFLLK
jgi:hypothetical protein